MTIHNSKSLEFPVVIVVGELYDSYTRSKGAARRYQHQRRLCFFWLKGKSQW
jgi:ATP-dependent exoDNAse (exonuclease V) beta subunit